MSSLEYRALTQVEAESAPEFNTRLFSGFWKSYDFESGALDSLRILDLGSVQSSSIDFFSDYSCYLTIADAIKKLTEIDIACELEDKVLRERVETHLMFESQPYDIILVWDCLNHLSPAVFPLVYEKLLQACHKKSHMHGFLYTSEMHYSRPGQFYILADDKMACYQNQSPLIRSRPMNSMMLMNKMPGFTLDRSVLIRNGMQEFILRRQ